MTFLVQCKYAVNPHPRKHGRPQLVATPDNNDLSPHRPLPTPSIPVINYLNYGRSDGQIFDRGSRR